MFRFLLVVTLVSAANVSGAFVVTSSRVAFESALNAYTTVSLETIAAGSYDTSSGVSEGSVNFVGVASSGFQLTAHDNCLVLANICLAGPPTSDAMFGYTRIMLPAGMNAFGLDFAGFQGLVGPWEIRLSTGDVVTGNFTGAFFAFDFAGIVSTDMIAYADIYAGSPNGAAIMDNIIYGSTVPEPGTVFGTAAALGVLLSLSFRRKSRPLTHGE